MAGLLALDLARRVGWAHCPPTYRSPAFPMPDAEWRKLAYGSEMIGKVGAPPVRLYMALDRWLPKTIKQLAPDCIAIEAPFVPLTAFRGVEVGWGLAAITEMHAAYSNIPLYRATPNTIKRHWTGNGRAKKPEMIAAAQQRGLEPQDDNAADACALLDYIVCELTRRRQWPPKGGRDERDEGVLGAADSPDDHRRL